LGNAHRAAVRLVDVNGDSAMEEDIDAARVAIVDGSGTQITSFGGGTQYTEADTDTTITGTAVMWEDGSDTLRAVSAAKPLPVSDAGGSLTVDGTVAVSGTVAVTQSGTWDEVGINDSGNSITVDDGGSTLTVDGSVSFDSEAFEDAAHNTGDRGVHVLGVRNDSASATFTSDDGDYSPISVDDKGRVGISDQGGSITVDGTITANLAAGTNTNEVVGDVAQDIAVAGNPVLVGARASVAEPTAMSADGDAVYVWADRRGRTVVAQKAATGTTSSVNDTASSATILAANTSRLGATVQNDSTEILYLKLGATATVTDYTVKMAVGSYFEVPFGYTGIIDGIWANNASGAARVTEIT
jgi:hypothetical protein